MTPARERKALKCVLKTRDAPPSGALAQRLLKVGFWLATIAVLLGGKYVLLSASNPGVILPVLGGMLLWGSWIGIFLVSVAARKDWPAMAPHIDFAGIQSRLRELDADQRVDS